MDSAFNLRIVVSCEYFEIVETAAVVCFQVFSTERDHHIGLIPSKRDVGCHI